MIKMVSAVVISTAVLGGCSLWENNPWGSNSNSIFVANEQNCAIAKNYIKEDNSRFKEFADKELNLDALRKANLERLSPSDLDEQATLFKQRCADKGFAL